MRLTATASPRPPPEPDTTVVDFRLGDVVSLRKAHPCGGHEWRVVRLGADIGLICLGCNRRILLARTTLEKRMRAFVSRAPEDGPPGSPGGGQAAT